MLNNAWTKLRILRTHHLQALVNGLNALRQKPVTTLMTIVVIAITLTLPALFWVFTDNLQHITRDWQQSGHMSLYLEPSLSPNDETALLERVRTTAGVANATLTTPAEGLAEFQQQAGMKEIMRYLPENPLPAVIDVTPTLDVNSPEALASLHQLLKSYPHVEQAKFDKQWISRLYTLIGIATQLAHGLMLLLGCVVILIIGNTLRLAIHNRIEEVGVLKLIGASDAFIRRPFLYLGVCYGIAGAALAILLVNLMILSLTHLVNQLAEAYQMHYALEGLSIRQTLLLLLTATTLGWLGARMSARSLCNDHKST